MYRCIAGNFCAFLTALFCAVPLAADTPADPGTRRLASFEDGEVNPFTGRWPGGMEFSAQHATAGRSSLLWKYGSLRWRAPQNWEGFNFLVMDVYNPAETPVLVVLEVQDGKSSDYWSRVNHPIVLPSGASCIKVPLQLYTGEKSRPGRVLSLPDIRSLTLSRNEKRWQELYLDNLRLLKNDAPPEGIWAFDFGPPDSPLFPGMRRCGKEQQYDRARGYGWRDAVFREPYPQAADALQPDLLYRDSVLIERGEFLLDLPAGDYLVFMNLDHPGGFWGEYPAFARRSVYAEGRAVVQERMNAADWLKRYFEFAPLDDWPQEDVFEKYLSRIFREKRFAVEVRDGQLSLRLEGDGCANGACFGLALSTLIIGPRSNEAQFDAYLSQVSEERRREFNANFVKVLLPRPGKPASTSASAHPPRPRVRIAGNHYMEELPAWKAVETQEIGYPLKVAAAQGESESLAFAIVPGEIEERWNVEVSDFYAGAQRRFSKENIKTGSVSPRLSRVTMDGSLYTITERYIRPGTALVTAPGRYNRFWATFNVPAGAAPGYYRGWFELRAESGRTGRVPVELEVYPFSLPPVDLPVGPFNSTIQENYWIEAEPARAERLENLSLARMREAGLTAFSAAPQFRISAGGGEIGLDAGKFNQMMTKAREAGFLEVVGYGHLLAGFDLCRGDVAKDFGMDAPRFYSALAARLDQESLEKNWLPVTFIVCDEPVPKEVPAVQARLEMLQSYPAKKIRFSVTFSSTSKSPNALLHSVPYPFLNLFDEPVLRAIKESGRQFCFYNRANRRTFGFYLYRLKSSGHAGCRLAWNWNQNAGNPYFALDSREDDYNWCNSTEEGELLCSVDFERHIVEGLDDYRYALALSRSLPSTHEKARRAAAEKLLKRVNSFDAGAELAPGRSAPEWRDAEALRRDIARFLKESGGQIDH